MWAKDVADLIWEAKRLRRWHQQILIQAQLKYAKELVRSPLANARPSGLARLSESTADALAAGWVTGSKSETAKVEIILRQRRFTVENVTVHGFLLSLSSIERIERLASLPDQRRDALLHEIKRKCASSTQLVPTDAADVLDVEHQKTS